MATEFLLDTGNHATFQPFPAYWQPLELLKERPSSTIRSDGVGGFVDAKVATLASLEFGSIRLRDVPAAFELPGTDADNETGLLGNCGDGVLERFHIVVDFPDGRILFSAGPQIFAPFPRDLVGIETGPHGSALRVLFVKPDSPSAKVEFTPAKKSPPSTAGRRRATPGNWQNVGTGQQVTLKFSDGSSKRLKRASFY